jgi:hypothetical protein
MDSTADHGIRRLFIGLPVLWSGLISPVLVFSLRSGNFITIPLSLPFADTSRNPAILSMLTPNLNMRFLMADFEKMWTSEGLETARKSTAGG